MAEIRGLYRSWGLKIMKPEVHDNTSGALALYRERTMTTKDGQRGRAVLLGAVFASFSQGVAFGHHSPAAFDISREITVAGTIVEYSFRNPHVYLTLEQRRPDGSTRRVEVEAGAGSVIGPLGFDRDAVAVGDLVTIIGNPARRSPDSLMMGRELYRQDGRYLPLHVTSRSELYAEGDAVADSLAGTWFPPRNHFYGILGVVDEQWPLTEKGRAAKAATLPTSTAQKDCLPLGEPALMFYPVPITLELHEDRLEMDIDWLESERTVWLDGRAHPPADQLFAHGHSVGHWEGDTLVIETTNFTANSIGLSMNVPSGTGKRVVERLRLAPDRKQLLVEARVEDPEYLTAPAEYAGEWLYRPAMQHSDEQCDLDVARRFLDD